MGARPLSKRRTPNAERLNARCNGSDTFARAALEGGEVLYEQGRQLLRSHLEGRVVIPGLCRNEDLRRNVRTLRDRVESKNRIGLGRGRLQCALMDGV